MGWMDSSAYGSKYYETPNMERLAAQSMRFTDAYALPLCSPSRASILTGQYSSRHGVTSASGHQPPRPEGFQYLPETAPRNQPLRMPISKNYLDPSQYTLAEALRDAGFATGHFGKWHLGLTEPHWPDQQGFETIFHCAPDPGPPNYFSPYGVHADGRPSGQHKVGNITDGPVGEHIADRLTDEAIKFIEANRGEPFYLNLWHYSVHGPWQHKEAYTAAFAKKTDPRGEQRNPVMASMLRSVDESLGRILQRLDQLDLADNTLFIFYSDNGGNTHSWRADDRRVSNITEKHPLFETIRSYRRWAGVEPPTNNSPLREGKGRIYEGGQRVPLMVRWPGHIRPASTSDEIVGPIDLYPTILDALNLTRNKEQTIDGKSFLPVLKGQSGFQRDGYFTWFPHLIPAISVRQGDWKLIRRFQPHPDYPQVRELYNLKEDLGETTNLATKLPGKVAQLDALIDRFVEETGALYPQPNPVYKPQAVAERDLAAGLVPKFCKATPVEGALRIEADGRKPFLGTAQVKLTGPLTLKLKLRSSAGGPGSVRWKSADQDAFPTSGQHADFTFAGGGQWRDITVNLPVRGKPGIVRIYVPAEESPVEIQTIQFMGKGSAEKTWSFQSFKP
jgi:arylsulfatase A-like enzyme